MAKWNRQSEASMNFFKTMASRRRTWRNGNKRPMPRNVPVGSQGNVGPNLVPGRGIDQDVSDDETFARLTHESSDGSESDCGPCWASKPVFSNDFAVDTLNRIDDGWGSFCDPQPVPPGLPSTPQSSWQP